MNYQKIIDISLPLSNETFAYPGTAKLNIETLMSETTKSIISTITMSSHTGTHIDAPKHAIENAHGLEAYDLSIFVGECRVIDLTNCEKKVDIDDLKNKNIQKGERILLKTRNSEQGYKEFRSDFIYLTSKAAKYLAEVGIKLIGVDYLSIKQRGNSDNTPHTAILSKNIPIIEGLDLSKINEEDYTLVVLPLDFKDLDGSPARAVLLK